MIKLKYLPVSTDIDELSPIQNRWIRDYVLPSLAVVFPSWVKAQPKNFTLGHLLTQAISENWDLTPAGWKKAEELGVLKAFERRKETTSTEFEGWLRHGEAAERLKSEIEIAGGEKSFTSCKSTLTKMGNKGTIRTNGKKGRDRRYDPADVDALALKFRNKGLKNADAEANDGEPDLGYHRKGDAENDAPHGDPNNRF